MGGVLFFTVIFLWIFLVCFTIKLANRKARLCPWVLEYNFISHFKFWRFWHYIVYFWKKSFKKSPIFLIGLPRWCSGKESACQCRRHKRVGFDPGSGRSPGVGNGNPLQDSCLEKSMDRAWRATVHRVVMTRTTEHN